MRESEALLCKDALFHSVPTRLYYALYVHFMQCRDVTKQFPLMLLLTGINLAPRFALLVSLSAVTYDSSGHKRLLLDVSEKEGFKGFIGCAFFFFSPFFLIDKR